MMSFFTPRTLSTARSPEDSTTMAASTASVHCSPSSQSMQACVATSRHFSQSAYFASKTCQVPMRQMQAMATMTASAMAMMRTVRFLRLSASAAPVAFFACAGRVVCFLVLVDVARRVVPPAPAAFGRAGRLAFVAFARAARVFTPAVFERDVLLPAFARAAFPAPAALFFVFRFPVIWRPMIPVSAAMHQPARRTRSMSSCFEWTPSFV